MKKYQFLYIGLISLFIFSSCEDNDKSPVLNQKVIDGTLSFTINPLRYSNSVYEMLEENADLPFDTLRFSQPDFGFTAAISYTPQVSITNNFTDSTQFIDLPSVDGEKVHIKVGELDKAIMQLYKGDVPSPIVNQLVYIRLKALPYKFTTGQYGIQPAYSNVEEVTILPYYIELQDALPIPYYIIGMADGGWNNGVGGLGISIYPLSLSPGFEYDKKTGAGKFVFTGYFWASRGFKLIRDLGSWGEQWGSSDGSIGNLVHNDGGSSDIKVPSDGYYTITLNTIDNTLNVVSAPITPTIYNQLGIVGDLNSWGNDIFMTPSEGSNNHIWYTTVTFGTDYQVGGGIKFRANADWGTSWGGDSFPYALSPSGSNILYKAGTYIVLFNDVDGNYYFFKQ
ncbi:MAG: SusE domain-containing protein [Paludibacteraceae bacterium]